MNQVVILLEGTLYNKFNPYLSDANKYPDKCTITKAKSDKMLWYKRHLMLCFYLAPDY